jgi:hypothetical protein
MRTRIVIISALAVALLAISAVSASAATRARSPYVDTGAPAKDEYVGGCSPAPHSARHGVVAAQCPNGGGEGNQGSHGNTGSEGRDSNVLPVAEHRPSSASAVTSPGSHSGRLPFTGAGALGVIVLVGLLMLAAGSLLNVVARAMRRVRPASGVR